MNNPKLILILSLLYLCSCSTEEIEPTKLTEGWFPQTPQNLQEINSGYDDFNSNIGNVVGNGFKLYYSNNVESEGENYDISIVSVSAHHDLDNDTYSFRVKPTTSNYLVKIWSKINSPHDEYGPFSFYSQEEHSSFTDWYFMYANNQNGDFDINFVYTNLEDWGTYDATRTTHGPFDAGIFNTDSDEFYPTINKERSKMYFCSNRARSYDIYEVNMSGDILSWLKNGSKTCMRNSVLSSTHFNDKCPYINGNLMVFTSDRDGGYGGFDLYYSVFLSGKWSTPVNFGPEINTEYDEYRPAIEPFEDSANDLMIFSSNRPGGNGGFDLYYTGIPKLID